MNEPPNGNEGADEGTRHKTESKQERNNRKSTLAQRNAASTEGSFLGGIPSQAKETKRSTSEQVANLVKTAMAKAKANGTYSLDQKSAAEWEEEACSRRNGA